jgi:hypothetical protein
MTHDGLPKWLPLTLIPLYLVFALGVSVAEIKNRRN